MAMVEEAFKKLYPDKTFNYSAEIKYSNKFSDYNANVKKTGSRLIFGLSKKWKSVNSEIVIGLIQDLLIKILRLKPLKTTNIDLYNNFVKSLHISVPKTNIDKALLESFKRVNAKYFYGSAELPNLEWGSSSMRKLASYSYHTDSIKVSRIFLYSKSEIIDYLIYHELLHKMLKFKSSKGRTFHHSSEFRKLEKSFENQEAIEKEISMIIRSL